MLSTETRPPSSRSSAASSAPSRPDRALLAASAEGAGRTGVTGERDLIASAPVSGFAGSAMAPDRNRRSGGDQEVKVLGRLNLIVIMAEFGRQGGEVVLAAR